MPEIVTWAAIIALLTFAFVLHKRLSKIKIAIQLKEKELTRINMFAQLVGLQAHAYARISSVMPVNRSTRQEMVTPEKFNQSR